MKSFRIFFVMQPSIRIPPKTEKSFRIKVILSVYCTKEHLYCPLIELFKSKYNNLMQLDISEAFDDVKRGK